MIDFHDRKRVSLLAFGLFVLFSALLIQFFKVQVIEKKRWEKLAKMQHQKVVKEAFHRGRFFATAKRDGYTEEKPLAHDVEKFHLYIDPNAIPPEFRQEICDKLVAMTSTEKKEFFRDQFVKKSRSRKLTMWLDASVKGNILAWWNPYARKNRIARNAVYFLADYKRSYPYGKLLGQVLQTVREDRDPKTGQSIPTGGLELMYDKILQGKEGRRVMLRSPRHPLDSGSVIEKAEDGANVYLTIDHYLQAIAEEEIEKAVHYADAKRGWAVMMEPQTGEILALAQYPFFEPEKYREYYSDPVKVEETRVRAITDCFEPGSIFKPITLAVALAANEERKAQGKKPVFDPNQVVRSDNGKLPGRSNPMHDVGYHKYLNMYAATQKSANIYLAHLIDKTINTMGLEWYRSFLADRFGFGKKTGIELPSESHGLLPRFGKTYPNGRPEWSKPTPYSLAIGHNLFTNTMHMLAAYAIIANGGTPVKPTLVRKIVKGDEVLYERNEEKQDRVLSKNVCDHVIRAMKYDTKPGGTCHRADVPGYTEVGKTGTSEKIVNGVYSKVDHFSCFVGFTPLKNPKFILMIGIDDPAYRFLPNIGRTHYGGKCAAPVFREISKRALRVLGVPPDDPHGYPPPDPRFDPEKADWHKEARILRDAYKSWNK